MATDTIQLQFRASQFIEMIIVDPPAWATITVAIV